MNHKICLKFVACAFIAAMISNTLKAQSSTLPDAPFPDPATAKEMKNEMGTSRAARKEIQMLSDKADGLLNKKIYSVVDKKFAPPCGNMHEYMSMAAYYWPDPSKPDGLPYIDKDGQRNPDNAKVTDHKGSDDLISYVTTLSWAYYFTNNDQYADKAVSLLRFWFIDTATKMLPNMNHAQIIRGKDTGRGIGIIDIHLYPKLIDAISILESSNRISPANDTAIHNWFKDFLHWLRYSKNGKQEFNSKNNHKTFYENLVLSIALFCKDETVVSKVLNSTESLMASQIQPDGKQPLELRRTNALWYSTFGLCAWFTMASLAERQHIDLWNYQTPGGGSIRKALDFLLPYVLEEKIWPYQQIGHFDERQFYDLLLVAANKYHDKEYLAAAERLKEKDNSVLVKLLYRDY